MLASCINHFYQMICGYFTILRPINQPSVEFLHGFSYCSAFSHISRSFFSFFLWIFTIVFARKSLFHRLRTFFEAGIKIIPWILFPISPRSAPPDGDAIFKKRLASRPALPGRFLSARYIIYSIPLPSAAGFSADIDIFPVFANSRRGTFFRNS